MECLVKDSTCSCKFLRFHPSNNSQLFDDDSMGILAFGLSTPRTMAVATGVVVAFWGAFQILVYLYVSPSSYVCTEMFLLRVLNSDLLILTRRKSMCHKHLVGQVRIIDVLIAFGKQFGHA